jgi:hypothetical protein
VTLTESSPPTTDEDAVAGAVFLDLDTTLLAIHQGRRGLELGLQADLEESLERLHQVAERVVAVAYPPPAEGANGRETELRLATLKEGLGVQADRLLIVSCPHGENRSCKCPKPDAGLLELAIKEHGLSRRNSWHIGADQEGVQAGRTAGLRTIRLGPVGDDHLSTVHRADYEARDLLDAANRIMLESLTLP